MKLFQCRNCGQQLYFENTQCQRCGYALGYWWQQNELLTLAASEAANGAILEENQQQRETWADFQDSSIVYSYCDNSVHGSCNWLIPASESATLCLACQLNQTIPDLTVSEHLAHWNKLERAKHRLVYSLLRLNLPITSQVADPQSGLAFDFLAEDQIATGSSKPVTTGHKDGVITIALAEADDAQREHIRQSLGEPYRTLLGHFRHEIAHYYWMLFARSVDWLNEFRNCFGNESQNYAEALTNHYANPQPVDWQTNFISAYASAHPWEDWAETWAHYLHMVDTLETGYAFGLQVNPVLQISTSPITSVSFDAYLETDFDRLIETWLPVSAAVNSLNRAMGQPDFYPFLLGPVVLDKMRFIHKSIRQLR